MAAKKIGFIGTGIMGTSMIRNLMKAGFELTVYNRTKEKALPLIGEGAQWADTAGACAAGQDVTITIVSYPKDVREVYYGENGILQNAAKGSYVVDMTTSSPDLAKELFEAAGAKGIRALDAPVTGGDTGAKAGTLTILCGGERDAFNALQPVFAGMGKNIHYCGGAGCGQHVKLCNQIAIAGQLAGACEAIAYAQAVGIDASAMIEMIGSGAAASFQLSNVAKRGLDGDFAPGFMLQHFIKDIRLADMAASENGLTMDVAKLVLSISRQLADDGCAAEGTQALLKHYISEA